jgi:hypothetical protein
VTSAPRPRSADATWPASVAIPETSTATVSRR